MRPFFFMTALVVMLPAHALAQRQGEMDAINRLIDRYGALEDAMDMNAQAQLMSADDASRRHHTRARETRR